MWTHASIRSALHERGVLIREVERTGLRRLMFACGAFLGKLGGYSGWKGFLWMYVTHLSPPLPSLLPSALKYVKTRFLGGANRAVLKR